MKEQANKNEDYLKKIESVEGELKELRESK